MKKTIFSSLCLLFIAHQTVLSMADDTLLFVKNNAPYQYTIAYIKKDEVAPARERTLAAGQTIDLGSLSNIKELWYDRLVFGKTKFLDLDFLAKEAEDYPGQDYVVQLYIFFPAGYKPIKKGTAGALQLPEPGETPFIAFPQAQALKEQGYDVDVILKDYPHTILGIPQDADLHTIETAHSDLLRTLQAAQSQKVITKEQYDRLLEIINEARTHLLKKHKK